LFLLPATSSSYFFSLSLHDALPISLLLSLHSLFAITKEVVAQPSNQEVVLAETAVGAEGPQVVQVPPTDETLSPLSCLPASAPSDRKSTRLNSSHEWISYAVFCLKT